MAGFKAQKAQGFRFLSCGRCRRRATLVHDLLADLKTQSTHRDEYTFHANAPEEHLVGKTVTKAEAASILKKHGLVNAGKDAKRKSKRNRRIITEAEIANKWSSVSKEPATDVDKSVDTDEAAVDTIVSKSWPDLKRQAKELGIKVPSTTKRHELEQLVREKLAS